MNGKDMPSKERKVWERRPLKKDSEPEKRDDQARSEPQAVTNKPEIERSEYTQPPTPDKTPHAQPAPVQTRAKPVEGQAQATTQDASLYYAQHAYLYAHPNVVQPVYPQAQYAFAQPQYIYPQPALPHQTSQATPLMPLQMYPATYYPVQPLPFPPAEVKKETKPEERMPERVYVNVGMVLTALSSVALFVYSMIYLFLFSLEHWDPSSFAGIWGLGAAYTVFAITLGIAAATLGIIATVFIHVRTRYSMDMLMILVIILAGIIQVNPVAIPISAAAFVFISLGQELFEPRKSEIEALPEPVPKAMKEKPTARSKPIPKLQDRTKKAP